MTKWQNKQIKIALKFINFICQTFNACMVEISELIFLLLCKTETLAWPMGYGFYRFGNVFKSFEIIIDICDFGNISWSRGHGSCIKLTIKVSSQSLGLGQHNFCDP